MTENIEDLIDQVNHLQAEVEKLKDIMLDCFQSIDRNFQLGPKYND